MTVSDLSENDCADGAVLCAPGDVATHLAGLTGWAAVGDGTAIVRRFEVKGFGRALEIANLAGFLANRQNHHPDLAVGWGYCEVRFTTHDAGGVTLNDLICAAKLNAMIRNAGKTV